MSDEISKAVIAAMKGVEVDGAIAARVQNAVQENSGPLSPRHS